MAANASGSVLITLYVWLDITSFFNHDGVATCNQDYVQYPRYSRSDGKGYDLLDREVNTLVNIRRMPGTYKTTFDGGGY